MSLKYLIVIVFASYSIAKEHEPCYCYNKFLNHDIVDDILGFFHVSVKDPFKNGLDCLNYQKKSYPEALEADNTVVVEISPKILKLEELDPLKKQIRIERSFIISWIEPRLKWPDFCPSPIQWYPYDLDKVWSPKYRFDSLDIRPNTKHELTADNWWELVIVVFDF